MTGGPGTAFEQLLQVLIHSQRRLRQSSRNVSARRYRVRNRGVQHSVRMSAAYSLADVSLITVSLPLTTSFTGNCVGYAAISTHRALRSYHAYPELPIALLVYDYFLTLPAEVNLFWKRRRTGAAVLFFANRYLSLLYNIADNTNEFGISTSAVGCQVLC